MNNEMAACRHEIKGRIRRLGLIFNNLEELLRGEIPAEFSEETLYGEFEKSTTELLEYIKRFRELSQEPANTDSKGVRR